MDNNKEPEIPVFPEREKTVLYHIIQYFMYIFMGLACMSFLSFIAVFIIRNAMGITIAEQLDPQTLLQRDYLNAYRFLQVMASIGAFVLSSFLYSLFVKESPVGYLGLTDKPNWQSVILVIKLIIIIQPVSSFFIFINQGLVFPESLAELEKFLRTSQKEASDLQSAFMSHHGIGDFVFNIFFIALLPAFGEELFFRKVSLRLLFDITKNVHVSIAIAALLFALIHGQVFLLLPLFLFGILLGYLAYWSGTLWLPVLAHFINNLFALTITFLAAKYPDAPVFSETYAFPVWITIMSAALSITLIFLIRKNRHINTIPESASEV